MPFRVCALCEKKPKGKLASLYWAWFLADESRVAWRQIICVECFSTTYLSLLQKCNGTSTDSYTCLGCGGSLADDLAPVFLNLYLPRQEAREFELGMCAVCAAHLQISMQHGAEKLPDRKASSPTPSSTVADAWAALEL